MRRVLAAAVLAGCVWAQESKRFDVATVKPNADNDNRFSMGPQPGGKFRALGVTFKMLLMWAYDAKAFQISGEPAWVNRDRWDIEAQAEGVPRLLVNDERAMLRALLEDRYQLKVHRETKRMPV